MSEATPAKPLRPSLPWARYPTWWKVAAAFAVGALIAAASLIKVLPKNAPGGRGGNLGFAPGEAGGTEQGEELIIDPKTGKVIRRSTIGGSTSEGGGSAGTLGSAGRAAGSSGSGTSVGGGASGSGGSTGSGGGSIICAAGRNGGATDIGVTATEVKLGATVAESGNAQAFLGQVRIAMDAVKNKVNRRAGYVCGRQLTILYRDDGWKPAEGFTKIQNLVENDKVFALAVVPSSEGLNQASLARYFQEGGGKGVPVVGTDGMIRTQNTDPNIWPVASATITQMHVMMKEAWDRGARNPAIVFENTYRFGVEGAYAFNQAYRRLSGGDIPSYTNPLTGGGATCGGRFCGIPAGTAGGGGQYGTQVSTINTACNQSPPCDFMAILLEPITAQNWMATTGVKVPKSLQIGMGAAQPLFTYNFGYNCHDKCAGLWVWTGYNPPIEQYRNTSAVSEYRADLQSESLAADEFNQFTQGGYIGMKLLVAALEKTPNLTRSNLIRTLDAMTLETGLAPTLTWRSGNHFANGAAQAFEIQSKNGFTGWRFVKDYVPDPWLGQDVG